MSPEKLAHMANQIATFFESQPGDQAIAVADHINANWAPQMRSALLRDAESQELHPLVRAALPDIRGAA
ncbi:formate dehydrogenase [Thioclava sp. BHET1]|uniref:Formate dehydrogenase n=1 Tax=Thioclava dalianensis TaxID=1185766 RepID=A0A074TDU3_9RHOB|nr:formate dehydrogenase subunit delta [Thioclava dalianensis]KEP69859.1 formate dehydrogenase [Thioclava dalianensis]TMV94872.1 formate dehydrogenase [Thioclava sp. BHET1]SFM88077.1 formate dehydrogenase subunit delta [Thioclava dalianensis]